MTAPAWLLPLQHLLSDALRVLAPAPAEIRAPLELAASRLDLFPWRVLVSGLCSVGKSSFVGALWGDSEMLPTAVRDCTQTNTLIRPPQSAEDDRHIRVSHLPRERAVQLALRGTQFHRLSGLLEQEGEMIFGRLAELPPEERLRETAAIVRKLFVDRADLLVLHEPLTDDLDQLEQFLRFLDSSEYRPGETVDGAWEQRREILMGARRPDGRLVDTGHMLAFEFIEMCRATERWDAPAPELIDTPWVPAFHNARRAELILEQAREADVLVVLSLPQAFQPEEWLLKIFRERPALVKRTLVVFNQVDTIDPSTLFSRDGFSGMYEAHRERMVKLGVDPANLLMSCARLPFLRGLPQDAFVESRIGRLIEVLVKLKKTAQTRTTNELIQKLLPACDPADAGVETLRRRMLELRNGAVLRQRGVEALDAIENLQGVESAEWRAVAGRVFGIRMAMGR